MTAHDPNPRTMTDVMNYCSACGASLSTQIPDGDTLPRLVCGQCATIHYENPKIVVGCIPEWKDRILLCKRAIEPRYGLWTFPAGFMEMDETVEDAAARETLEEANAAVEISQLYAIFSIPQVNQVYIVFRGIMNKAKFGAGRESLEVTLLKREEIPWPDLAFPVIHETLERYCRDAQSHRFGVHVGTIRPCT